MDAYQAWIQSGHNVPDDYQAGARTVPPPRAARHRHQKKTKPHSGRRRMGAQASRLKCIVTVLGLVGGAPGSSRLQGSGFPSVLQDASYVFHANAGRGCVWSHRYTDDSW